MFKLLLFGVGLAGGAGGTMAWLLSEPEDDRSTTLALPERLEELKRRLQAARAEGEIAGEATENRIRHEFETYRSHPDRPGAPS